MNEQKKWEELEPGVRIAGRGNPVSLHILGSTACTKDPVGVSNYLQGTHIVSEHLFHGKRPYTKGWEKELKEHNLRLAEENDVSRIIGYSRGGIVASDILDEYPLDEVIFAHPALKPSGSAFLPRSVPLNDHKDYREFGRFMSFLCPEMDDNQYWKFIDTHWEEYAKIEGLPVSILKNELKGFDYDAFHRRIVSAVSEARARILVIAGSLDPYHRDTPELKPVTRVVNYAGHFAHVSRPFDVACRINEFSLNIRNSDDEPRHVQEQTPSPKDGKEPAMVGKDEQGFGF